MSTRTVHAFIRHAQGIHACMSFSIICAAETQPYRGHSTYTHVFINLQHLIGCVHALHAGVRIPCVHVPSSQPCGAFKERISKDNIKTNTRALYSQENDIQRSCMLHRRGLDAVTAKAQHDRAADIALIDQQQVLMPQIYIRMYIRAYIHAQKHTHMYIHACIFM